MNAPVTREVLFNRLKELSEKTSKLNGMSTTELAAALRELKPELIQAGKYAEEMSKDPSTEPVFAMMYAQIAFIYERTLMPIIERIEKKWTH